MINMIARQQRPAAVVAASRLGIPQSGFISHRWTEHASRPRRFLQYFTKFIPTLECSQDSLFINALPFMSWAYRNSLLRFLSQPLPLSFPAFIVGASRHNSTMPYEHLIINANEYQIGTKCKIPLSFFAPVK